MTTRATSVRDPVGWLNLAMVERGHSAADPTALKS